MYGWFTTALPSENGSKLQVFSLMLNILHGGQFPTVTRYVQLLKNRFSRRECLEPMLDKLREGEICQIEKIP
jgi:hypothetical protein